MHIIFLGLAIWCIFKIVQEVLLIRSIYREEEDRAIAEGLIPPKWWRWQKGRQESGYAKMLLATSKRFKFDCYILKFPNGIGIPEHTDPAIPGFEHHRLNIFLNSPCVGTGLVSIDGPHKRWLNDRIQLFRPDLYKHSMTPVEFIWSKNSMYILSIGWLKKQPQQGA